MYTCTILISTSSNKIVTSYAIIIISLVPPSTNQTADPEQAAVLKKKRTFRKFTFRGVDLDQLLDMTYEQLMGLVHARARRRFSRGELRAHCVITIKSY